MKRRCKNIDITDYDFILRSVEDCLRNKRKSRNDILRIREEIGTNEEIAKVLQNEITDGKLKLKPIRYRNKYDDNSQKWRRIGIQDIKQQMYDYVAVNGLWELEKSIGHYQCASVKEKGQIYCAKAIASHIRDNSVKYYCKMDIRKYYESIPRDKLMEWLRKRVKNRKLLWLIQTLLDTFDNGLSIGSYLSQHLGNLYLSDIYHKLEALSKTRRGKRTKIVTFQAFYMDDILIVGKNSRELVKAANLIAEMCREKGLEIKPTWSCQKIDNSFIDMAGYRIYRDHITVRRGTMKKIRRTFVRYDADSKTRARRVISHYGIIKHADSYKFCRKYDVHKKLKSAKEVVSKSGKKKNCVRQKDAES